MPDIVINGATYPDTPGIAVPRSGGGTVYFTAEPPSINLLHNADWGYSLVNQRTHTGAVSDAYCIDRWIGNGTVTPSAGSHVALASGTTMTQRMEIIPDVLFGKTVTFAYQDSSDNVYSAAITFPSSSSASAETATVEDITVETGFIVGTIVLNSVSCASVPYIKLTANSVVNIRRVWAEFGEMCHMETTPPMDYANNLVVCQRYLRMIVNFEAFAGNMYTTKTVARGFLPYSFRTTPTISPNYQADCGVRVLGGSANRNMNIETQFQDSNGVMIKLSVDSNDTRGDIANPHSAVIVNFSSSKTYLSAEL